MFKVFQHFQLVIATQTYEPAQVGQFHRVDLAGVDRLQLTSQDFGLVR